MRRARLAVVLVCGFTLPSAAAAPADVVYHFYTKYQWRIHRISAPYQTHTRWRFCAQSHGGTVGCSRAVTHSNTVTGQVGVTDGVLSAALGYNVTQSVTLTGNASYKVPRHHLGIAEWRLLFSTRAVHQRQYSIRCDQFTCFGHWRATNHYETAYASRYIGPDFREVVR